MEVSDHEEWLYQVVMAGNKVGHSLTILALYGVFGSSGMRGSLGGA